MKVLYLLCILNIFFLPEITLASSSHKTIDHIVVYYSNPEIISEGSIGKFEANFLSQSAIYIGNKIQIDKFMDLHNKILKQNLKPKKIKNKIFLQIDYIDSLGFEETLFIDQDGSFEFKYKTGEIPQGILKELVQLCESLKNIVDFRFQQNKFLEHKDDYPACASSIEELSDFVKSRCGNTK